MSIANKEAVISINNFAIAENVQKVYDAGYDAGILPIFHLQRLDFYSATFPDGYELTLYLKVCKAITFQASTGIKKLKLITDTESRADGTYAFRNTSLEVIDFTESATQFSGNMFLTFYDAVKLKSILGLDCKAVTTFNTTFGGCKALEDVSFVSETIKASLGFEVSSKLTEASLSSIVNGLADLTGGTAQTLALHSTVLAKLTDDQYALIISKNWNVR